MSLKENLQNDLKEAMRGNNEVRKRTLRMVLAAIRLLEVEKGVQLDDSAVVGVLQKEVKARHEAIAEAERAGRSDLVAANREELEILESYLPKAMSEAELEALVRQAIAEVGAESLQQMGLVMKWLMPRLQGRASGEQASQMVRRLLS
ncbi:MAG: GatB/YqeY domain-containing protein [Anaerolineales bacterium]|nr:GatB/YqeY domain-containing protein [Anaerolineales bacterium]MCS7248664.1 GatB/YqeY domain-containing protein [Anaerolineales bacterium]MDW8162477.1 GatB/YqeY domain-containing protein [Anaerolineales bacterium]MDW8447912.1 GatB/YqeY domain-containing protein [Anaerolineales bacterium]